jgi:hypothetical protein
MSASIQLDIKVENLDRVRDVLRKLSGPQARQAYANAMNDTGGRLRKAMRTEYQTVFDNPTSYVVNSPWVNKATADRLSLAVGPRNVKRSGVDPQKILQAQEFGGRRADKRFEVALRQMGLLPNGMQIAIPAERYGGPFPGSDDGRGNFNGNFVRKLLAYLKVTASKVAAMKKGDRNRALKRYQFSANLRTRREVKLMDGFEWFVSDGRARLAAGVWVRGRGVFRCAVAFVARADYKTPKLSMEKVQQAADLQAYFDKRVRFRVREAAGV